MGDTSVKLQIFTCLLALFVLFTYPLLLLCFLPIYLLRLITKYLKNIFRSDLGQLISVRSCYFASDPIWTRPKYTIVYAMTLQGHLSLETLRSTFVNRVLYSEKKNGACLHPELLQYPARWLGFPVWVNEPQFILDEHIKHYDGPVTFDFLTDSVLGSIVKDLTVRPFIFGKSLWELILLNNYQVEGDLEPEVPKSVIILRIHHSMADGFSILKLFDTIGDMDLRKWMPTPKVIDRSFLSSCLQILFVLLKFPYDFAKVVLRLDTVGPWLPPESKLGPNSSFGISSQVPLDLVKKTRDLYGATTTGVILAAISGALRRIMLESPNGLLDSIVAGILLPMPGHPDDKLTNHFMTSAFHLPLANVNAVERLRSLEENMKVARESTLPLVSHYYLALVGALYPSMTKVMMTNFGVSLTAANFVGSTPGTKFLGLPIIDGVESLDLPPLGMGCMILSTNGNIRIVFILNEAMVSDSDACAERFADYVVQEFDELYAKGHEVEGKVNFVDKNLNFV